MSEIENLKRSLKSLNDEYSVIPTLPPEERSDYGKKLNIKKQKILESIAAAEAIAADAAVEPLDITAPFGVNGAPVSLRAAEGSRHPLMTELDRIADIYSKMGFDVVESRQIDDEYNMFESLNFPVGHPARDGYDTFRTAEGFIPPAHTSTMQHRILKAGREQLKKTGQIATVIPGRVFRNEDVDATHEHTFYQCEGVFVSKTANLSEMLGTLREFFVAYYEEDLKIKTQPGYFPFTEPSLEFLIEKPSTIGGKPGDYLEMLGCGMIHPNVLRMAGIDPKEYKGFAWGGGIDRFVLLKYGVSDIRLFHSARLDFLKDFK